MQEEVTGTAVRDTLPVLAFASRTMPVALGTHVTMSVTTPDPPAAKVIVRGLVAQVAFGAVLVANPTEA